NFLFVMGAGKPRYIILYTFPDDGQIFFRPGVTGHNLYSSSSDATTHVHVGSWRIHVDLDDPAATKVSKVCFSPRQAKTAVTPLTCEARLRWDPEHFTRLRIEGTKLKNRHDPASFVGYELQTLTSGTPRYE